MGGTRTRPMFSVVQSLAALAVLYVLAAPVPLSADSPCVSPEPTLSSISPTGAAPSSPGLGLPALTLTAKGANFAPNSILRWNGSDRQTVILNSSTLQASIHASDLAAQGTAHVAVFTPTPGGGLSNSLPFTIVIGGLTLSSISPASAVAGGPGFILFVEAFATGFSPGDVVLWNGERRQTSYRGGGLSASISAIDIASPGVAQVSVERTSPPSFATVSHNALPFNVITAEGPCVFSLAPESQRYNGSGGTGSFEVSTVDACPWSATSSVPWIVLTSGPKNAGRGMVSFGFTANTGSACRSGNITVAGQTFSVIQDAAASSVGSAAFEPQLVRKLTPGFYILEARLSSQAVGGLWGMEVLAQTAGGFNLGGGVSSAAANPGFGAFLLASAQAVTATLNAQVSTGTLMTLRFLDSNKQPVGDPVMGIPPLTVSRSLTAGFYVVEVYSSGPTPFNFQLGLEADFFAGGIDTGGYLGPGSVGFGAFYVPETQDVTMKLYGRSTYGGAGAGDLVLTLRDANRNVLATVTPPQ